MLKCNFNITIPRFFMSFISTAIVGVYASPSTLPLVNQYLSCAAAKKLLSSEKIQKPLYIETTKLQNFAETQSFFDKNYKPTKMKILIPEGRGKTEKLGDLFFEVFNAGTRYVEEQASIMKDAAGGKLSMDAFARKTEINELKNAHEHAELRLQCQSLKLPPDDVVDHLMHKSIEVALFAQDADCHTDIYRMDWLDSYQKAYCLNSPNDKRSCKAVKKDLCDLNQVQGLSKHNRNKVYKEQICKLFPQAHKDVKTDSLYQNYVKKNCLKQKDL